MTLSASRRSLGILLCRAQHPQKPNKATPIAMEVSSLVHGTSEAPRASRTPGTLEACADGRVWGVLVISDRNASILKGFQNSVPLTPNPEV